MQQDWVVFISFSKTRAVALKHPLAQHHLYLFLGHELDRCRRGMQIVVYSSCLALLIADMLCI
jgi:hypothetical protein